MYTSAMGILPLGYTPTPYFEYVFNLTTYLNSPNHIDYTTSRGHSPTPKEVKVGCHYIYSLENVEWFYELTKNREYSRKTVDSPSL